MDLYLIDGHSLLYRSYYAIRSLTNAQGFPTNAVYGFTAMILKLIRDRKPDALAVVFDSPGPTERHALYAGYKALRPEMPSDLVIQIPKVKEILAAMNVPVYEIPGSEADDILCTLAIKTSETMQVFLVTGDKDLLQIVSEKVRVYDPVKQEILGPEAVRERFGVSPERIPEFLALSGDATDNIPGVKGIGEKTTKKILSGISSLDELLSTPEKAGSARFAEMISMNRDMILLSLKLATVNRNVPVVFSAGDLMLREPDWTSLGAIFRELDFRNFLSLIPDTKRKPGEVCRIVTNPVELDRFFAGR